MTFLGYLMNNDEVGGERFVPMTLIQLQDTRPWMVLGAGQQWAKWKVILIVIWIATQQRGQRCQAGCW